jgi:hypothetical protein
MCVCVCVCVCVACVCVCACVADVVFSTCHKAKGLEFSTVKLTSDFLDERIFSGTGSVESAVQQLMTRGTYLSSLTVCCC